MLKIEYPKYLFHADNFRKEDPTKPIVVTTVEEHQAREAEGWAESPEAARGEPRHTARLSVAGEIDVPPAVPVVPKVEYPKYLFAMGVDKDSKPTVISVLVANEVAHAALAGGPWFESPDEVKAGVPKAAKVHTTEEAQALAHVNGTSTTSPATALGEADPNTTEQPSTPPADPPAQTPLSVADLTVEEAELYIDTVTDFVELAHIANEEEARTPKPRAGVKKAIEARIEALTAPGN